jgi:predicted SnoaL-like aldol condensation-catalyzing enzyme
LHLAPRPGASGISIEEEVAMTTKAVNQAQTHKEAATEFMRLVASKDGVREAYRRYAAPNFRHHNPHFRGDAESLMAGMEENAAKNPEKKLEVLRAIQEGDLVAVHSRVQMKPGDTVYALSHIFRFEGDRVVELWDISQPVPENSPNENGVF